MKIPKYIQNIMYRAEYEFDRCLKNENYSAGYTVRIKKETPRTLVSTFEKEINRLKKWVEKQGSECYILYVPTTTHYYEQYAVVTIYDNVMQKIEKYMKGSNE